jgi:hypothetical protein
MPTGLSAAQVVALDWLLQHFCGALGNAAKHTCSLLLFWHLLSLRL